MNKYFYNLLSFSLVTLVSLVSYYSFNVEGYKTFTITLFGFIIIPLADLIVPKYKFNPKNSLEEKELVNSSLFDINIRLKTRINV